MTALPRLPDDLVASVRGAAEAEAEPGRARLKEIFIPLDDSSILTWILRVGGRPLED